jgi:hypothetical protein
MARGLRGIPTEIDLLLIDQLPTVQSHLADAPAAHQIFSRIRCGALQDVFPECPPAEISNSSLSILIAEGNQSEASPGQSPTCLESSTQVRD